jgi:hypothetical protein
MRFRVLSIAVCAALVGAALGGGASAQSGPDARFTASAGAADCIWAGLPPEIRDGVAKAQTFDQVEAAVTPLDTAGPDKLRALAIKCGVPQTTIDPAEVAQHAIIPKSVEIWSRHWLEANAGLTDEELNRAWARLDPASRAAAVQWFLGGFTPQDGPAGGVKPMLDALGVSKDPAAKLVMI